MSIINENKKPAIDGPAVLDENKKIKKLKNTERKEKVKASFANIAPAIDISNNDFIEMRSGEFLEIIQITSKDIYSLNKKDLYNDVDNFAHLYVSYSEDLKLVPLNIPLDLAEQKRHFTRKMNKCTNPLYKKYLSKRISEFELLEKNRTNREYFLFLYHKDEMKLKQKVQQVRNILSRSNPAIHLSLEKKISILFQMANPNTKPITD